MEATLGFGAFWIVSLISGFQPTWRQISALLRTILSTGLLTRVNYKRKVVRSLLPLHRIWWDPKTPCDAVSKWEHTYSSYFHNSIGDAIKDSRRTSSINTTQLLVSSRNQVCVRDYSKSICAISLIRLHFLLWNFNCWYLIFCKK